MQQLQQLKKLQNKVVKKSGKQSSSRNSIFRRLLATPVKFALLSSCILSACATVVKGTSSQVSVTSTPSDASVIFIDENKKQKGSSCRTPCTVELDRQGRYLTTISKVGYDDYALLIVPRLSSDGFVGNLGSAALFGAVGFGVDQASGATKDLQPSNLNIILQTKGKTSYRVDENGILIKELFENRVQN